MKVSEYLVLKCYYNWENHCNKYLKKKYKSQLVGGLPHGHSKGATKDLNAEWTTTNKSSCY